ncbi:hypothetical protein GWK47_046295 [Chionoecetes opilio]|uniref:Uncharacterized protein n=1 Tax=Chionoecetes opilio TaxID=41210 RepID=A0A8J4Y5N0_CHIOP|nr:hypothetical protein GWK47_046295 [Chionoecetes opilio]
MTTGIGQTFIIFLGGAPPGEFDSLLLEQCTRADGCQKPLLLQNFDFRGQFRLTKKGKERGLHGLPLRRPGFYARPGLRLFFSVQALDSTPELSKAPHLRQDRPRDRRRACRNCQASVVVSEKLVWAVLRLQYLRAQKSLVTAPRERNFYGEGPVSQKSHASPKEVGPRSPPGRLRHGRTPTSLGVPLERALSPTPPVVAVGEGFQRSPQISGNPAVVNEPRGKGVRSSQKFQRSLTKERSSFSSPF